MRWSRKKKEEIEEDMEEEDIFMSLVLNLRLLHTTHLRMCQQMCPESSVVGESCIAVLTHIGPRGCMGYDVTLEGDEGRHSNSFL